MHVCRHADFPACILRTTYTEYAAYSIDKVASRTRPSHAA